VVLICNEILMIVGSDHARNLKSEDAARYHNIEESKVNGLLV